MNNVSALDRLIRTLMGVTCLELGFFWLAGGLQMGVYLAGAVLLLTAAIRFCPLYRLLGINPGRLNTKTAGPATLVGVAIVFVALLAVGSYASSFFTRKLFLEDFNAMNDHYKQTLFLTGKNERAKAVAKYEKLISAYRQFQTKYTAYHPYALRDDGQLNADLMQVGNIIAGVDGLVRTGDLHQAHLGLENVRPVFQDIFKRNGFSMLAVALVDFHDSMELMLDAANAKDAPKLVALYPQVSDKLKTIEAEANDPEIQAIRKNLDELLGLAQGPRTDQLAAKGEALKNSFVKVYLARG